MTFTRDDIGTIAALNAKHFPNDPVWQAHCEKMARYWAAKEEGEKK